MNIFLCKMSHLKRIAFSTICFASYVGLIFRVHNLLAANQNQSTRDTVPLLDFEPMLVADQTEAVDSYSEQPQEDALQHVLHEDVTVDQDVFQDAKYTHRVFQNGRQGLSESDHFTRYGGFDGSREIASDRNHPLQRTVDFVQVGDVYVYGAYLDLRQQGNFTVQILALKRNKDHDSLVCHVVDGAKHHVLYAQAYRMCENHGKVYEGWIYSCVLPQTLQTLPHNISVVSLSQRQAHSKTFTTLNLKTIPSKTASTAGQIGVCVPPLFGDLNLSLLINFIQMCKVLGAGKVFMYVDSVSSEIKKFLKYHSENDASLSVIDWNLPENVSGSEDRIWYHGQLLAVQDCLYHNMDSFHFLLFMDLDEMLVPQDTHDWQEMLTKVFTTETKQSVAALSFNSVFFDLTRVPEESENILYFQHLHRTRSISRMRNKLLVQPLKVFELGIHHLSKALSEEFKSVDVSDQTALLHHYHTCVKINEPPVKCYPTKRDRTILKYKDRLKHLSHRVITDASKLFA